MDILVKAGADLNLKNKEGRTVAEEAKEAKESGYAEWPEHLAEISARKND